MAKHRFYSAQYVRAGNRRNPRFGKYSGELSVDPFGEGGLLEGRYGYCRSPGLSGCMPSDYNAWLSSMRGFYQSQFIPCKKNFEKHIDRSNLTPSQISALAFMNSSEKEYEKLNKRGKALLTSKKAPNKIIYTLRWFAGPLAGVVAGDYFAGPIEDIILCFENLARAADRMNDALPFFSPRWGDPDRPGTDPSRSPPVNVARTLGITGVIAAGAYMVWATQN